MQLKGSSYFFLIISISAIVCIFGSCKTTQPVTSAPSKSPEKPSPKAPVDEVEKEKPKDFPVKFNIALVLPFDLKSNFATNDEGVTEPEIKQNTLPALNFYEGALIAADSLNTNGREIKLTSYETPADSAGISRLFSNALLKDAGLVIATFPNAMVPVAAALAEKNGINLILTQASEPDFLENKKNVALAFPSTETQCREVVSTLLNKNPSSNIILIYRTIKREEELAEFFRSEILKNKTSNDFKEINATDKGYADVVKFLSKTKRNLVFVVSSDEAFISPLLALIEEQNIYGIMLNGLPTWQNFESIDFMSFQNIQVNIFENNFINYEDPEIISIRKKFISRYYSDPLPSAFNGFNLVYRIGASAGNTKINLHKLIEKSFEKTDRNFKFEEYNSGGMENRNISILRFNDYKLEVVPAD